MDKVNRKNNQQQKYKKKTFHNVITSLPKWIKKLFFVIAWLISSGLVGIWYSNYLNEPELVGRVLLMISSEGVIPNLYDFWTGENQKTAIITVFISIGNKRKVPVSIIDYLLILNQKNGTKDTCSPTFLFDRAFTFEFEKYLIFIKDNSQNLLEHTNTVITSDSPLTGFLQFTTKQKINKVFDLISVKVILYDTFGSEYSIETNVNDFRPASSLPYLIKSLEIRPLPDSTISKEKPIK